MKKYLIVLFIGVCCNTNAQKSNEFTDLYGDFLGQVVPGDTPVVFAPDIVSSKLLEHSAPVFTPDGNNVYWWGNKPPKADNEKWSSWGLTMKRVENRWTKPVKYNQFYGTPVFSADGKKAYYSDYLPGDGSQKRNPMDKDIWLVEKQGDEWGEAKCIHLVERYPEIKWAGFPTQISIADNGNLYFIGYLKGTLNNFGIYRTRLINGKFTKPELLPSSINMLNYLNWTPFIATDESFLIFSSNRNEKNDKWGDLYISYHDKENNKWSEPINMGSPINTIQQERLPGLSPDGKFLFFTRPRNGYNQDVWWVKSDIISRLRKFAEFKE